MRALPFVLAIVLLSAGLAGCVSDDDTGTDAEPAQANNSTPTIEEPNVTFDGASVYAYDSETTNEIRWENGSFSPATCFACPDSERRIDITGMLPSGAPSLVDVQLNTSATFIDAMGVYLSAPEANVYHENETFDSFESVLAPAGSTVEVVVYNSFPDARQSLDYELRIKVQSNRTAVPTDVPIELPQPEDPAGLVVEPLALEGEPRLMLWDGQDAFLGHHPIDGQTTINVTDAQGDALVGFLTGADGIARIAPVNASATDTEMRPLGTTWKEEVASISGGNVTIEAPVQRVPLQVGLFIQGSLDAGIDYAGTFTGPNGTLFTYESGGYLFGTDGRFEFHDEPGDAGLGPGEYSASFEFGQSTGGEAGAMWRVYER